MAHPSKACLFKGRWESEGIFPIRMQIIFDINNDINWVFLILTLCLLHKLYSKSILNSALTSLMPQGQVGSSCFIPGSSEEQDLFAAVITVILGLSVNSGSQLTLLFGFTMKKQSSNDSWRVPSWRKFPEKDIKISYIVANKLLYFVDSLKMTCFIINI